MNNDEERVARAVERLKDVRRDYERANRDLAEIENIYRQNLTTTDNADIIRQSEVPVLESRTRLRNIEERLHEIEGDPDVRPLLDAELNLSEARNSFNANTLALENPNLTPQEMLTLYQRRAEALTRMNAAYAIINDINEKIIELPYLEQRRVAEASVGQAEDTPNINQVDENIAQNDQEPVVNNNTEAPVPAEVVPEDREVTAEDEVVQPAETIFSSYMGQGMPTPYQEFIRQTGSNISEEEFNNDYEIVYSGAIDPNLVDVPFTPYSVIRKPVEPVEEREEVLSSYIGQGMLDPRTALSRQLGQEISEEDFNNNFELEYDGAEDPDLVDNPYTPYRIYRRTRPLRGESPAIGGNTNTTANAEEVRDANNDDIPTRDDNTPTAVVPTDTPAANDTPVADTPAANDTPVADTPVAEEPQNTPNPQTGEPDLLNGERLVSFMDDALPREALERRLGRSVSPEEFRNNFQVEYHSMPNPDGGPLRIQYTISRVADLEDVNTTERSDTPQTAERPANEVGGLLPPHEAVNLIGPGNTGERNTEGEQPTDKNPADPAEPAGPTEETPAEPVVTNEPTPVEKDPTGGTPTGEEPVVEEPPHYKDTVNEITAKLLKDLYVEENAHAKDHKKYMASNIRVAKQFKEELKSGNYLYNIVHFPVAVVHGISNIIRKSINFFATSARDKDRIAELRRRVFSLSDEDVETLWKEYRGNRVLTDQNPTILNILIDERMHKYALERADKINAELQQHYINIFTTKRALDEIEAHLADPEYMAKHPNYAEEAKMQKAVLLRGKADLVHHMQDLYVEGNNLLSSGYHGFSEDIRSANGKMNLLGLRFAKRRTASQESREKAAVLEGISKINDDELALKAFITLQALYSQETEIKGSIFGKRSVGTRYYSPLVEELDYRADPFLRDLLTTIALTTSAVSIANAIHVNRQVHNLQAQGDSQLYAGVRDAQTRLQNNGDQIRSGFESQAHQAVGNRAFTGERRVLDENGWVTGTSTYRAADNASHAAYNQFADEVSMRYADIASRYQSGLISQAQAVREAANVANDANATLINYWTEYLPILKQYAANNPQFELGGLIHSMEQVVANPTAVTGLNNAIADNYTILEQLAAMGITESQIATITGGLPSDLGTAIAAAIVGPAAAVVAANSINRGMGAKNHGYGNDVTRIVEDYVDDRMAEKEKEHPYSEEAGFEDIDRELNPEARGEDVSFDDIDRELGATSDEEIRRQAEERTAESIASAKANARKEEEDLAAIEAELRKLTGEEEHVEDEIDKELGISSDNPQAETPESSEQTDDIDELTRRVNEKLKEMGVAEEEVKDQPVAHEAAPTEDFDPSLGVTETSEMERMFGAEEKKEETPKTSDRREIDAIVDEVNGWDSSPEITDPEMMELDAIIGEINKKKADDIIDKMAREQDMGDGPKIR